MVLFRGMTFCHFFLYLLFDFCLSYELNCNLYGCEGHCQQKEDEMDKKIKKLQKETKKLAKDESSLLKADKKRDKVCDYGEKMMKKKK